MGKRGYFDGCNRCGHYGDEKMTELGFLLDLLLQHKLPKATREAVAARIKDVENRMTNGLLPRSVLLAAHSPAVAIPPHLVGQSPSTIAAMMRHEQAGTAPPLPTPEQAAAQPVTAPVAIVAQTPAAQAAMAKRSETVGLAISGKPAKGETSPRKW